MALARRNFIKSLGLGLASASLNAKNIASFGSSNSESLFVTDRDHPTLPPKVMIDYLQSGIKKRVQTLKENLSKDKIDAILLESDVNKVYFSGCFRGSGKRTTWVLFPTKETDTAYWFSPGLDRDLISSWWSTENNYYFCFPHGEGGFPNKGQVVKGRTVNLFDWLLTNLKKKVTEEKDRQRICILPMIN